MANEHLIEDLRKQFDRYIDLKNRLDTKANNMIMMSGTIATLFMGFGIFLMTKVDVTQNIFFASTAVIALVGEIALTTLTIINALNSYKLREYYQPISDPVFFQPNGDDFNSQTLDEFRDASKDEYEQLMVKEHLRAIRSYRIQNNLQTKGINWAQITFTISVIMIPIFTAGILLTKYPIFKPI